MMEIINVNEEAIQVGGAGACAVVCIGSCVINVAATAMGLAITAL